MSTNCQRTNGGRYAVRHNPATYYTSLRAECRRNDVPLGARPDLSAGFTFVTPNLCHDTHDCAVSTGDAWLSRFLPTVFATAQYRAGTTAVFLTWDESDVSQANHIATLVVAPSVPAGTRVASRLNHLSLLRTTEDLLGISTHLGGAATATSMRRAFGL